MDVRQLDAFLAVAEHLHFGRAADQLYMAQAPLSRTISGLEAELGTRLFDRNTRSVALTEAGRFLVEPAREALEAVKRAADAVRAVAAGEMGTLRVEFSGVAAHPVIAVLARQMKSRHPGIRLELASQSISRPAMKHLVDEDIDLALGRWDQFPPGVAARVVLHDSLVIALPSSHRLAGRSAVSFAEVARDPFVSLPYVEGSITADRLWRLGFATTTAHEKVQFAPDTASCIALVSAQVGCHLALGSVASRSSDPNVVFVDLDERDAIRVPDVHLRAAWRLGATNPAVNAALELLDRDYPDLSSVAGGSTPVQRAGDAPSA